MANVTASKAAVGGAIWMADKGTAVPTDASTSLSGSYSALGYVDENGTARSVDWDAKVVRAWGGDVVAVLENSKTETFKFRLIDSYNLYALGLVFGNSTGSLAAGITVKSTGDSREEHAFVIAMIEQSDSGEVNHRICIPRAVLTDLSEINYKDSEVTGYEVTLTALADTNGNTAYDYYKAVSTST